ncbi:putative prophage phiRv2 integrase [Clostridium puniceum]|uniref:Putative prophage phiRv2 integrase n=1 Tax=Clostridium puniceum TaxID=29367 RepID=A0A1S8TAB4_9CLOT|nr:site-specific integrase [Clostridium puniceum]OOM74569.1 putative prophage phiRv2 integrase [Clostridium puniceum]
MEGSVTKRKDGRWQGVVDIPTLTNKRVRKYVYAPTRQECRKKVNALIEEIEGNGMINPSKAKFKEFSEIWLNTYCVNLSPTTVNEYKRSVDKYACAYLGDHLMTKILPINIQEMINEFSKAHSRKTCKNLLSILSAIFNYAKLNKILKNNPCDGVRLPNNKKVYKYYIYNEDEFNTLLDVVTGTKEEIPILLAALCGLRMSEIMGLTWDDIDFNKRIISIQRANVHVKGEVIEKNTKTKTSYRKIIAPRYVIERLSLYKGVGYVYPKKDGSAENGNNYSNRFSRMLKKNKFPHTRFHDLRHFNATMMLKNGITDKEAAERLGHSDTNMTKKYQHVLENMKTRSADILDSIVIKKMDVKMDVE